MKKNFVIFDLVATLTDSGPRYVRAFEEACRQNGVKPPSEEDLLAMLGNKSLSEITDMFVGKMGMEAKDDFMTECNDKCDALLNSPSFEEHLYPGARAAVEELQGQGVTLGVFTGTRQEALQQQLVYHKLTDIFAEAYRRGKDSIRDAGKTSATLKTEQLSSLVAQFRKDGGADDACIIVVGDAVSDFRAASALGLQFIGFGDTEIKRRRLQGAGVQTVIRDMKSLPGTIRGVCP